MKKVSKAILLALGILLAVVAVVVLGVNLYIQSAGTQARIQRWLSRALHTPVKIASMSFMPWTGLKLTGITGQDTGADAAAGDNILQIPKVNARIQLWKLLDKNVVVRELSVDGAKITWNETPEGKWRLPLQIPEVESETPPEPATAAPEAAPVQTPPPAPSQPPAETVPQPAATPKQFPIKIDHFLLREASFNFCDKNRKPIVTADGINMLSAYPTVDAVTGSASVHQISAQDLFFIRNCQTEFSYSPEHLSLFNARCVIAGGASIGSLNVKIAEPETPFNFDAKFSDIQLERLLADAGVETSEIDAIGTLGGFLHLQGNLRNSTAATGKGQLVITGGHIAQWSLLRQIADLLHSDKLKQFNIDEARANYHLADGKVLVDEIVLKAVDLSLTGQGPIELNGGTIALKCRLTIGGNITRQIPEFLMENFGRDDAANTRYVDFDVYGTVSKPKTDLLKLIGNNIEHGAKNIFKNLFGRKPKPQFIPAPAPSPVVTPAEVPAATASPTP
ncbi:MAG: AsmA family protein [Chthoniobacteraceae bacterium]